MDFVSDQTVEGLRFGALTVKVRSESGTLSTYPVLSGSSPMALPAKAICNRTAASTACCSAKKVSPFTLNSNLSLSLSSDLSVVRHRCAIHAQGDKFRQ